MAVAFRAAGTWDAAGAAITPGLPAGIQTDDILLLFVHTQGDDAAPAEPSGWTVMGNIQMSNNIVRMTVFYKRVVGGESAPTVADVGNHQMGQILAFSGVLTTAAPEVDLLTGSTTSSTSISLATTGTTTVADTMYVFAVGTALPDSFGTNNFSAWACSSLTSITEQVDKVDGAGVGGGVGIMTGIKATAGAIGQITATTAVSHGGYCALGVRLKPAPVSTTVTVPGALTATALTQIPVQKMSAVVPGALTATALNQIPVQKMSAVVPAALTATALAAVPVAIVRVEAPVSTATALAAVPVGTVRVEAPVATATALAPEPVVSTPITVTAETSTATALAPEPVVVIRIEPPAATATALAPEPTVALSVLIAAEVATATAAFPVPVVDAPLAILAVTATATGLAYPITFAVEHHVPVMTNTGRAPTPTRAGPQGDTLYREIVEEIVPPPVALEHYDSDTGDSVIGGDPAGRSRVFDGIDDVDDDSFASRTADEAWSLAFWFQWDPGHGTAQDRYIYRNSTWSIRRTGAATGGGHEGQIFFSAMVDDDRWGPNINNSDRHMVVITYRPGVGFGAGTVTWYLDGVVVSDSNTDVAFSSGRWGGFATGEVGNPSLVNFKGRIDEIAVFDHELLPGWALELYRQGTGEGGPKTRVTVLTTTTATALVAVPATAIRPVPDSWQLHDEFTETSLDEDIWEVLSGLPFIVDDEMRLPTGTVIQTRHWYTFAEWFADIDIGEIPPESDMSVNVYLIAAYGEEPGLPFSDSYETQMLWNTTGGGSQRRYVFRSWDVYSNGWDDVHTYQLDVYDYDQGDDRIILTSPHPRLGQNITHMESASYPFPGALTGQGFVPYRYMAPLYEGRVLRLVIQVEGDPGDTFVLKAVNATGPTTVIDIPTGRLATDVSIAAMAQRTNPVEYQGVIGPRRMRPPVMQTTTRFLRPQGSAQVQVEYPARVTWGDFRIPQWAGDARPVSNLPGTAGAFGTLVAPILVGEPRPVSVDAVNGSSTARMLAPVIGGAIAPSRGIVRFTTTTMVVEITTRKMPVQLAFRELVNA